MQSKQDKYVEEFKALWDELGGAEAAIKISEDDLIVRAARLGASERQIYSFLGMRQTFVDIEEGVQRQNRDSEYAAEVERGAAKVDSLVQSEIKGSERDWMSGNVDLTELTARELVAYGEQAGWTTDIVREALAYRESLQILDSSYASLRQTMNDPTVMEAIRICEEQPSLEEPRGWFSRLKHWLS